MPCVGDDADDFDLDRRRHQYLAACGMRDPERAAGKRLADDRHPRRILAVLPDEVAAVQQLLADGAEEVGDTVIVLST